MENDKTKVIVVDIEKEMKKSYLDYSMAVIVGRALPDVRDGLKPVHRRILYTMFERGLTASKGFRKCADTVGAVLGSYHPHGDAAVYDALVRLAQDFSLRYPLVNGQGNFGSIDGDPPAAYRYTEAKMAKMAEFMLTDIEKETVDFKPNYDDRLQEPEVLPSRFPNLLVNGSTGIAVGMATNIPPHNMREVIDGMDFLIDHPDASVAELMDYIKGPDFPTGGIIMGYSGIRAAYATGRGKITLRGRAEIVEGKNGRSQIIITEIPYMVNKSRLVESIANLVKEKRVEGISGLRDQSNMAGIKIVVELKKDAIPQVILNQLYSYTQLQDTVGVIMLAMCKGEPKVLTLKEMLENYIEFQKDVVTRRTKYDLRKAQERAHILEALHTALDYIDEVIDILRSSKSIAEGKERLMERFGFDDVQASAIVAMRLGQLTGLEREKIEEELAGLMTLIGELEAILGDESLLMQKIKDEANAIREKYGDDRRTEIAAVSGEVDIEDLIPVEQCVLTLTRFGYIKRQPVSTYKAQKRGGRGIAGMTRRDEDFVDELFICSSHDYVLFMTNKGRMYRQKCYQIPEGSRTSKGINIVNLLPLEEGEKVNSMIRVSEFKDDEYLVMVTKHGIVKRTPLSEYQTRRRGGIICISLEDGDELAWVRQTNGHHQLIVATKKGRALRFDENDARPLGRTAHGVKAITLQDGDEVVGMARVREGATLATVTEHGLGRRTDLDQYRLQNRGGKGITNYKVSGQGGDVCGIKVVDEDDDLIIISSNGVIIRMNVSDISIQSRYAQGVRVMRVAEDEKVVTVARAEREEEEDAGEESVDDQQLPVPETESPAAGSESPDTEQA
ncbi:DNA gyrase subunit A [Neobittarella massiliensis]|uniref:DNA gyrase subunit A n=1 Tax=Neobittarella massiliensis (ex Bilen et al. 2018) TaxID=2041842 RepID=A0A8J6IPS8_9FIRM|nr:DNA gyrase subunit A [Neobittarella massiliensis]MBC3516607.1 DNA gyrase subunit A [Neobittarella massiliensis]